VAAGHGYPREPGRETVVRLIRKSGESSRRLAVLGVTNEV
jgi:hypothetical protein